MPSARALSREMWLKVTLAMDRHFQPGSDQKTSIIASVTFSHIWPDNARALGTVTSNCLQLWRCEKPRGDKPFP